MKNNQKLFASVALIIAVVFAGYFALSRKSNNVNNTKQLPAVSSEMNTSPKLTLDQLKNAIYIYDGKQIKLTNGIYNLPVLLKGESQADWYVKLDEQAVAFGDLDNDGIDDAAVVLGSRSGGTGYFESLVVMLNKNGQPVYALDNNGTYYDNGASLGDRTIINSLSIQNQEINISTTERNTNKMANAKFYLTGHRLEMKQATAWKTYTNAQYGFSLQYPLAALVTLVDHVRPWGTDLLLPCDGSKTTYTDNDLSVCEFASEKEGAVGTTLNFFVFPKPMNNLESYARKYAAGVPKLNIVGEYKKIQVDGIEAHQVHFLNGVTRVFIQNSKNLFIFDYTDISAETANQILSSFKLTK